MAKCGDFRTQVRLLLPANQSILVTHKASTGNGKGKRRGWTFVCVCVNRLKEAFVSGENTIVSS